MKVKLFTVGLILALASAACTATDGHGGSARKPARKADAPLPATASHSAERGATTPKDEHGHDHAHASPGEVPAFQTEPAALKSLPPTLAPALFNGKQRLGYEAARAIPQTIAQLPCYCHCDKGFGHKSLHSCFVDDHAAHCAVCIDEALMAYKLEKDERLSPAQIRERIIAHYSRQ